MIEIDHLSFGYRRKEMLFDDMTLSLPSGNIYGLLGKNGAGKSTFLRLISGLVFPKQGTIEVNGLNPAKRYPQTLREIFVVNEEFHLPNMTGHRFVSLYSPFYPRFDKEQFSQFVEEFQLSLDQKLHHLSFGQKKKFMLSFGLATDCELLVLDEPTNGLDIPSKSQFRRVVASAIHERRTFVLSTHQVKDVENLIDPMIIVDEGEIVLYEHMERIAQKLSFKKGRDLLPEDALIYAEPTLGGYQMVCKSDEVWEENISLELLFKATINAREKMYQLFNSK